MQHIAEAAGFLPQGLADVDSASQERPFRVVADAPRDKRERSAGHFQVGDRVRGRYSDEPYVVVAAGPDGSIKRVRCIVTGRVHRVVHGHHLTRVATMDVTAERVDALERARAQTRDEGLRRILQSMIADADRSRAMLAEVARYVAPTDAPRVSGFDVILSLARMAVGNAKDEAFVAVRHQVVRLRAEYERLGFTYEVEGLTRVLAEGPHRSSRLIRPGVIARGGAEHGVEDGVPSLK